jgi:hypothetical protein
MAPDLKRARMDTTHAAADGQHDFDFLFGRWRIHNRKLVDTHDHSCTEWVEFESTSEAWPMLGGLGNVDRYSVAAMPPGGQPFEGMTIRLYVPETRRWRIWWASTRFPGELDTPLEGGFVGDRGEFLCDEVVNGVPVKVRFDWQVPSTTSIRWEQSFSYDEGRTWKPNWLMESTRDS